MWSEAQRGWEGKNLQRKLFSMVQQPPSASQSCWGINSHECQQRTAYLLCFQSIFQPKIDLQGPYSKEKQLQVSIKMSLKKKVLSEIMILAKWKGYLAIPSGLSQGSWWFRGGWGTFLGEKKNTRVQGTRSLAYMCFLMARREPR